MSQSQSVKKPERFRDVLLQDAIDIQKGEYSTLYRRYDVASTFKYLSYSRNFLALITGISLYLVINKRYAARSVYLAVFGISASLTFFVNQRIVSSTHTVMNELGADESNLKEKVDLYYYAILDPKNVYEDKLSKI